MSTNCVSTARQRQLACSSLPQATALTDSDQFMVCSGGCAQRKTIGEAAEGGCDARLVRRGTRYKWDVHDMVYFGEPNTEPGILQLATKQGVVAKTGTPQTSCQNNYDPNGGYMVPKKAFYKAHVHVQMNFEEPVPGATRNKVFVAIRQQGNPVITDVLESPVTAITQRRQVTVQHLGPFDKQEVIDVLVWLEDADDVNPNVTFSVRSITIQQE